MEIELVDVQCKKEQIESGSVANSADEVAEVTEGLARISTPTDGGETFYNPVQEFNRDLTVIVLKAFTAEREAKKEEQKPKEGTTSEPAAKQRKITGSNTARHPLASQQLLDGGGIRVLDALSASGLRAIRFALEVPNVERVLANDFSERAVEAIRRNVELNGVQDRVEAVFSDAIDLMMAHRKFGKRFHAVDLDPYGSASVFLDAAVQAVMDEGLLMVTCTDTAILCGNTAEACFNKYGSVPLRHKSCHELALRILLRAIDGHANRHKRYIVPLLSVSVDFYVRCFVRIRSGAAVAKDSVTKLAHMHCCATCQSLDLQPLLKKSVNGASVRFSNAHFQSDLIRLTERQGTSRDGGLVATCAHCGGTAVHTGGPIWVAPTCDVEFVGKLLAILNCPKAGDAKLGTRERLEGLLTVLSEELHDVPLFYEHDQLMNVVKCPAPKMSTFRSALLNAGYRCSISHCNPRAIKTDAPTTFLWDVCREWAKRNGIKPEGTAADTPRNWILTREAKFKINFTTHPECRVAGLLNLNKSKLLASSDERFVLAREKKQTRKSSSQSICTGQFPKTPDHYWDTGYPTRDEQLQRGYLKFTNSPLFKKTAKRRLL
uniref:tRNA (guanine(26)-N(2))-dimethyltransferase n=1 Tax=Globodera rostochiensis TaxID=31243 RepID=A0A914HG86_GLORO